MLNLAAYPCSHSDTPSSYSLSLFLGKGFAYPHLPPRPQYRETHAYCFKNHGSNSSWDLKKSDGWEFP